MSHPIKIVLPEATAERLLELVEQTGETPATLAARLVKERLEHPRLPAPRTRPRTMGPPRTPPWLEPDRDRVAWRAETWSAIVALHQRYPQHLAGLQAGWWGYPAQLEILGALAHWRALIDHAAKDPREELLFHAQLAEYGEALRASGRGVANAWQPGAPPDGWATR